MNGSIVKRNLVAAAIVTAIALLVFAAPGRRQTRPRPASPKFLKSRL